MIPVFNLEELTDLLRRLFAFYTWMNRVTECLYRIVMCRSCGISRWLKFHSREVLLSFLLFIFENDKNLSWVYQNGNFLPGKNISRQEKNQEK